MLCCLRSLSRTVKSAWKNWHGDQGPLARIGRYSAIHVILSVKTGMTSYKRWPQIQGTTLPSSYILLSVTGNFTKLSWYLLQIKKSNISIVRPAWGLAAEISGQILIDGRTSLTRNRHSDLSAFKSRTETYSKNVKQSLIYMVIDLQDVGARYYTFIWTMALVMKPPVSRTKTVVILDSLTRITGKL